MSEETATTIKKTTRTRRTATKSTASALTPSVSPGMFAALEDVFEDLLRQIAGAKEEFVTLQKSIEETKILWVREQREHEVTKTQQDQQDEIVRKREQESYEYETKRVRKLTEDAFAEKKASWERELASEKEVFAKEREELGQLRKMVAGFDAEKERAVKDARETLGMELKAISEGEKKLREQEAKAERELFALKIANLTQDNTRQAQEIESLKKAFEDATRQLKDVAVKVIESSNSSSKLSVATE